MLYDAKVESRSVLGNQFNTIAVVAQAALDAGQIR